MSAVAVISLFIASHPAAAQGLAKENGERLREACGAAQAVVGGATPSSTKVATDAALCLGFLEGFAWGHGWAAWRRGQDMYFCPPEKFSYREALPAVMRYLEAHPERLDAEAHVLVFSALSAAFPCTP